MNHIEAAQTELFTDSYLSFKKQLKEALSQMDYKLLRNICIKNSIMLTPFNPMEKMC